MALIRMCVVPNCTQRLSWPILLLLFVSLTEHTLLLSVYYNGSLNLPLAFHPPANLLICAIGDITVAVKKSCSKSSSIS